MKIFNLLRQNKTENDPYWEFDKSNHFKPKVNTEDFLKLTDYDFGWLILEPISTFIQNEEGEFTKGNTLSYGQ